MYRESTLGVDDAGQGGTMINAELIYNPYLLETDVRFNGNPPRINSLIEKYAGERLQAWVSEIPSIFYNEMNGYDFDLAFSGTELDYLELKQAFALAGVGEDQVRFFHKGELESRNQKTKSIDALIKWLEENPNRKFDYEGFRSRNREFLESAYSFIVIGGVVKSDKVFDDLDISIDNVESVDELRKTDLHYTPILLYLDRKSIGMLPGNLGKLLKRRDVTKDQLFFMISPALGGKTERVIKDLGINEPQLVNSADDPRIYRYFQVFPVSEYIYDAITIFRKETDELGRILEEENKQNEIINKEIHEKLKNLDDMIGRLKTAYNNFSNKGNLPFPTELKTAKAGLLLGINQWKVKKTKINKEDEAIALSRELDMELSHLFDQYIQEVNRIQALKSSEILTRFDEWYESAEYQQDFKGREIPISPISDYYVPDIMEDLMNLKEEMYVTPKEAFLGRFFKASEETAQQPVLETTFYCEKWRAFAVETIDPIADKVGLEVFQTLSDYYEKLSEEYTIQIMSLIREVEREKREVSSQLSEDERLLQTDNEWYTVFCDKLYSMERS